MEVEEVEQFSFDFTPWWLRKLLPRLLNTDNMNILIRKDQLKSEENQFY